MRIVLAGGCGSLGRRLAADLSPRGHEVDAAAYARPRHGGSRMAAARRDGDPWPAGLQGMGPAILCGFTYELTLRPADVAVLKDWAERGEFISRLSSRDAGSRIDHFGKYVVVWARGEDYMWRIDRYLDVTAADHG